MNRELELLLLALDAFRNADEPKASELRAIYESRLEDFLLRRPGLSHQSLETIVDIAYRRWLKAQDKPSTLPPKA